MNRWIDRWNDFWFPETTTVYLAVCRIVMVASLLFQFTPRLVPHHRMIANNPDFVEPQLIVSMWAWLIPRTALPDLFTLLFWICMVSGVTALVGLFTRISLFFFALTSGVMQAHLYSYGDIHHNEAIFCMFIGAMAFAPSDRWFSVDALIRRLRGNSAIDPRELSDMAVWPVKLTFVLMAWVYCSTGLTKLVYGGLEWMNGYTLQYYSFSRAIHKDMAFGIWLAEQHQLSIVLSYFTVAFETFFPIAIFTKRWRWLFLVGGIMLHIGMYLARGGTFIRFIIMLSLMVFALDPVTPKWAARRRP